MAPTSGPVEETSMKRVKWEWQWCTLISVNPLPHHHHHLLRAPRVSVNKLPRPRRIAYGHGFCAVGCYNKKQHCKGKIWYKEDTMNKETWKQSLQMNKRRYCIVNLHEIFLFCYTCCESWRQKDVIEKDDADNIFTSTYLFIHLFVLNIQTLHYLFYFFSCCFIYISLFGFLLFCLNLSNRKYNSWIFFLLQNA